TAGGFVLFPLTLGPPFDFYTLSLHDALPISPRRPAGDRGWSSRVAALRAPRARARDRANGRTPRRTPAPRSDRAPARRHPARSSRHAHQHARAVALRGPIRTTPVAARLPAPPPPRCA